MDQQPCLRRVGLTTGVSVPFVSAGPADAVPVVLLHAWGESLRSFDRLLPLLPRTIHAVAMDLRGHGDADKPAAGYSIAEVAADVVAFMDAVGIPSAVLLGSSSGGYVAQQVAITSPHRVTGLVLVGSPRSLQGRPSFADEVDQLADPVDAAWVRRFLTWFPLFHQVPQWYIEGRVQDGAGIPSHVWRATLAGLVSAPAHGHRNDRCTDPHRAGRPRRTDHARGPAGPRRRHPGLAGHRLPGHRAPGLVGAA